MDETTVKTVFAASGSALPGQTWKQDIEEKDD